MVDQEKEHQSLEGLAVQVGRQRWKRLLQMLEQVNEECQRLRKAVEKDEGEEASRKWQ